ncbi:putative transporter SVOPL [Diachasmimorpha longicaudata]|uniref:putative transporter SVOPL n=1 Tax=Diachasmimorpha longicaudata TaxID=58733 RepID=UPI0030B8A55F
MNEIYENAITKTGWGLCNYFIIGLCSMCTMAEAGASLVVVILTPLLACDRAYGKQDVMTLNAVSSLGMAVGALIFGTLGDSNGRKLQIPTTMIVIFCASIGLSFSQSYILIGFCIFILGVGVSGNNAILRVYMIECLPAKRRGICLAFLDFMWIAGMILALAMSWWLVPSIIRMLGNEFRPSSWRVLAGISGAPSLIMACATSLLPSSPRYLVSRRRPVQALSVLQQIFAINHANHADNFPQCNLDGDVTVDEDPEGTASTLVTVKRHFSKTWKRIVLVCSPKFMKNTLLLLVIRALLFPGFIWMSLWTTHLTHVTSNRENTTLTLSEHCVTDTGDIVMSFLHNCHVANYSFFEYSIILSSGYALGECLLMLGVDAIGKKLSIITSSLTGGTSLIALIFLFPNAPVLSITFLASYSIMHTITTILLLENYPTSVRGTMTGLTGVLPHLVSFFIKFLMHIPCTTTLYIVSSLLIGAAIPALLIPDFTNAPMQE